jgi:hypothetical protein
MSNYRPISILNNFSKLFEFIIHDHVSHYAKFDCNQYGLTRTKSTVTNLATFLDLLTPDARSQRQPETINFTFQTLSTLSITIYCCIFSDAYVSWFRSYITNSSWHSLSAFSSNIWRATRLCPGAFTLLHIHKLSKQLY